MLHRNKNHRGGRWSGQQAAAQRRVAPQVEKGHPPGGLL